MDLMAGNCRIKVVITLEQEESRGKREEGRWRMVQQGQAGRQAGKAGRQARKAGLRYQAPKAKVTVKYGSKYIYHKAALQTLQTLQTLAAMAGIE